MISVSVYDDNKSRRESLQMLLELTQGMECVGIFEDCNHVISQMESAEPDLVLMDIEMPGTNGIEGVRQIKKHYKHIRIIMQTAFDDEDRIFAALKAGAEGYILKSASVTEIIKSIEEVMNGGASMSPSIALKVMRYFNVEQQIDFYKLTSKENEVLKLLSNGLSYKMVADELNISYFTVNNHIKKIYEKLHVHSLGEAVALAHRDRLV